MIGLEYDGAEEPTYCSLKNVNETDETQLGLCSSNVYIFKVSPSALMDVYSTVVVVSSFRADSLNV